MKRLWWASLLRSFLGAMIVIGAFAALASLIEVYFFAIILLVLVVIYRGEILGLGARDPRISSEPPGASAAAGWRGSSGKP